jgi:hypothetical protein
MPLQEHEAYREYTYARVSDGTRQACAAWRPSAEGAYPTVVHFSPYTNGGASSESARRYQDLEAGYAYLGVTLADRARRRESVQLLPAGRSGGRRRDHRGGSHGAPETLGWSAPHTRATRRSRWLRCDRLISETLQDETLQPRLISRRKGLYQLFGKETGN